MFSRAPLDSKFCPNYLSIGPSPHGLWGLKRARRAGKMLVSLPLFLFSLLERGGYFKIAQALGKYVITHGTRSNSEWKI